VEEGWSGQNPPYNRSTKVAATLPDFGDFHTEKVAANLEHNRQKGGIQGVVAADFTPVRTVDMSKVPSIDDIRGTALAHLTDHMKLSLTEHVVAKVNDDLCINCGRCMLTCNDTGYQAISFSTETHKVEIKNECTGCGLCGTVCPVAGCIDFVPRETEYVQHPQCNILLSATSLATTPSLAPHPYTPSLAVPPPALLFAILFTASPQSSHMLILFYHRYNIYRGIVSEGHQIPLDILEPVPPADWTGKKPVIRSPGYQ
jgi:Pyruvate/2-oxoacid:ferredoxin oxidoreductase delta subunit